jgi:hypothetical protein
LGKRGLSKNGKKTKLCARLKEAMVLRVPIRPVVVGVAQNNAGQQIAGFSVTAKWKVLKHLEEAVAEPVNTIASYAPTIPAEDAAFVPVKHNFAEVLNGQLLLESIEYPRFIRIKR